MFFTHLNSSSSFQLLKCHTATVHCSGGGMGQLCQSLALLQHLRHSLYCFEGVFYHKLEGVDVAEILDEKLDS